MTDATTPPVNRPVLVSSAPPPDLVPAPGRFVRLGSSLMFVPITLGLWLFLSIFAWPHTRETRLNTASVGVLVAGVGAVALYKPWLRWALAGLVIWLAATTLALDHFAPAAWNNLIVAGFILIAVILERPLDRKRIEESRA